MCHTRTSSVRVGGPAEVIDDDKDVIIDDFAGRLSRPAGACLLSELVRRWRTVKLPPEVEGLATFGTAPEDQPPLASEEQRKNPAHASNGPELNHRGQEHRPNEC